MGNYLMECLFRGHCATSGGAFMTFCFTQSTSQLPAAPRRVTHFTFQTTLARSLQEEKHTWLTSESLMFPKQNGSHMHTKHLITGHYLYNFSYGTDGQLSGLVCRDGHGIQVRRDAHGVPLWLALPGGQVYWLSLSNSGTLRKVSAQGHDIAHITYHGNTGLLATKSDENSWTTVYE